MSESRRSSNAGVPDEKQRDVAALILAGGKGRRFGGEIPKQFHPLAGKPLLLYCLEAFESFPEISGMVVVLPTEYVNINSIRRDLQHLGKLNAIIPGGDERQDSVISGLSAFSSSVEYVAIHDGDRPFPPHEATKRAINAAEECGAAILALPVMDTIKASDDNHFITGTLDRTNLWLAQTPQVFRKDLIIEGYDIARKKGILLTDDAGAIQLLGKPIRLVEGSVNNLKITVSEDFKVAERLINHARPDNGGYAT